MKKIFLSLLIANILVLTGCSNVVKVKTNHENKQEKVIATAQKDGKRQRNALKSTKKRYITNSESVNIENRPKKLTDFTTEDENRGIVLKGIVTDWANASKHNNQVMTKLSFYITNQLNYKTKNNMTGKTISIYMPGGYTTFSEKQTQEKEKVFIDDVKTPLPRIGDQLLVVVQPFDLKESEKLNYDFNTKIKFDKNMPYQLAAKEYSIFNLNKKTHKYESKVITGDGRMSHRKRMMFVDHVGVKKGEPIVPEELLYDLQTLLNDINTNYN